MSAPLDKWRVVVGPVGRPGNSFTDHDTEEEAEQAAKAAGQDARVYPPMALALQALPPYDDILQANAHKRV